MSITALSGGTKIPRLPPPYHPAELIDKSSDTCATRATQQSQSREYIFRRIICENVSVRRLGIPFLQAEGVERRGSRKHSPHNLNHLTTYWYNTGTKAIFKEFIHLEPEKDGVSPPPTAADSVIFLIKRAETVYNLWHTLMQMMSLTLSLDALRMTIDPNTGSPFFSDQDVRDSRVLILDRHDEGPFFELWTMFAAGDILRLGDNATFESSKVVIPLPGGSNSVWEGDWVDISCNDSSLLEAFSERILNHYRIPIKRPKQKQPTLTLIDRSESRRLRSSEQLFAALRSSFPGIKVELVDFAEMSFPDQIRLVRSTDILVGVHGAGLTHELFLVQGSTVIEIMPEQLKYKGFANMTKLLGHHYLTRRGAGYADESGDWHVDDVSIDEDEFLKLIGEAVSKAKG